MSTSLDGFPILKYIFICMCSYLLAPDPHHEPSYGDSLYQSKRSHTLLLELRVKADSERALKVRFALHSTFGDTLFASLRRRLESTRYAEEEARPSSARARA